MAVETQNEASPSSLGLRHWQVHLLSGISALALGLLIVTIVLSVSIGGIRKQLAERQGIIDESIGLGKLNLELAQLLANLAVATRDEELKRVLWDNGITFSTEASSGTDNAALTPGTAAGASIGKAAGAGDN